MGLDKEQIQTLNALVTDLIHDAQHIGRGQGMQEVIQYSDSPLSGEEDAVFELGMAMAMETYATSVRNYNDFLSSLNIPDTVEEIEGSL